MKHPIKHMVIPDTQCKPGVPLDHMRWAGEYAAHKMPHQIIHIGDGADMPSLSSYDEGKKSFEGRSYRQDVECWLDALSMFMKPINIQKRKMRGRWKPKFDFTLGNHEYRIIRAVEEDRKLEGLISVADLGLERNGWTVHPYRNVILRDGIAYSHYFASGVMGRPVASARSLVTKKHMSCVMGHVQKTEIDFQYTATGKRLTGIFAGCYYQHDEPYLGPQVNADTWRGIWMFYNVDDGEFTLNNIPLEFLKDRYA
jgi:hypothetical protein